MSCAYLRIVFLFLDHCCILSEKLTSYIYTSNQSSLTNWSLYLMPLTKSSKHWLCEDRPNKFNFSHNDLLKYERHIWRIFSTACFILMHKDFVSVSVLACQWISFSNSNPLYRRRNIKYKCVHRPRHLNPISAKTRILRVGQFIIMAADAFAPCTANSSTFLVLPLPFTSVLVLQWQDCNCLRYLSAGKWLKNMYLNSLWPSDAIWRHSSGSTLTQVMVCCLTAPSH